MSGLPSWQFLSGLGCMQSVFSTGGTVPSCAPRSLSLRCVWVCVSVVDACLEREVPRLMSECPRYSEQIFKFVPEADGPA